MAVFASSAFAQASLFKSSKRKNPGFRRDFVSFVGVAGFEPTTSSTPCWRDTGLRYTPFSSEGASALLCGGNGSGQRGICCRGLSP